MTHFICSTCGTQFDDSTHSPHKCPICEDERQYVGWNGQCWTTSDALAARHSLRIAEDGGLLALGLDPAFAINQRALLLPTGAGNILWESLSLVTQAGVDVLRQRGGVKLIAISHPHFYSSMVEWSVALGDVPIFLHEADRQWVMRPHPNIRFWSGDRMELAAGVSLIRTGGHFPGSTVLHWQDAARPDGALFSGDAPQVAQDRRHVAFLYSYPNMVPMRTADVVAMRDRLSGLAFDDVYGFTWGRNIIGGGRQAVDQSFVRHLQMAGAVPLAAAENMLPRDQAPDRGTPAQSPL